MSTDQKRSLITPGFVDMSVKKQCKLIDLVEFPEGVAGKSFTEKIFTGTIQQQLRDVLSYIKKFIIKEKVIKY